VRTLAEAGHAVQAFEADLREAEAGERLVQEVEDALGPLELARVQRRRGAAHPAGGAVRAQHWHAATQAKYFTTLHAVQPAIVRMAARGGGSIVNIVGTGGKLASPIHLARRRGQRRADAGQRRPRAPSARAGRAP
jgi:NADP-dependent 3-hydroxy acid dehydrogenase YdfG